MIRDLSLVKLFLPLLTHMHFSVSLCGNISKWFGETLPIIFKSLERLKWPWLMWGRHWPVWTCSLAEVSWNKKTLARSGHILSLSFSSLPISWAFQGTFIWLEEIEMVWVDNWHLPSMLVLSLIQSKKDLTVFCGLSIGEFWLNTKSIISWDFERELNEGPVCRAVVGLGESRVDVKLPLDPPKVPPFLKEKKK